LQDPFILFCGDLGKPRDAAVYLLYCILKERGSSALSDIFAGDLGGGIGVDTGEDMDIFGDNNGEVSRTI